MAIPWLSVLRNVPWSDVIGNAPKLAEGAKNLWSKAAGTTPPPAAADTNPAPAATPDAEVIAALQARVKALEQSASELHGQMLASSEMVKALADQNALLVERIEAHRVRIRWLVTAIAIASLVALAGLVLAVARPFT